jgi:hypothetical protein
VHSTPRRGGFFAAGAIDPASRGKTVSLDEAHFKQGPIMSANRFTKRAMVAAACAFIMSIVGAAEWNDDAATASSDYCNPFSLPCHPSTDRGCTRQSTAVESSPTRVDRVGLRLDRPDILVIGGNRV